MNIKPSLDVNDLWLKAQYGELLEDARALSAATKCAATVREKGRLGRASVVLSAAPIEAVSNDALASIVDLYSGSWPSEDPPWVHFRGRSDRVPERLLDRGRFERKTDYLISLIWRCTPVPEPDPALRPRLRALARSGTELST